MSAAQMRSIKRRGREAEKAVAEFLAGHGWPFAERRRLRGAADRGDVTGTPAVVWEVKASDQERSEAMREAEAERVHDGADYAVVVERRKRYATGQWYATLPLSAACELLREAGYGDPLDGE